MTRKEARQKICPVMSGRFAGAPAENPDGLANCRATDCAVWEVLETEEKRRSEGAVPRLESDGWKMRRAKSGHNPFLITIWYRPIPLDEQPGHCGLIIKGE